MATDVISYDDDNINEKEMKLKIMTTEKRKVKNDKYTKMRLNHCYPRNENRSTHFFNNSTNPDDDNRSYS